MGLFSPIVEPSELRSEFPVLERVAYLNAGTDGPLPSRAVSAARSELERELAEGRAMAHFERRGELASALREAYGRALRADPADVALTTSTTEGMGQVVMGLELRPGDEILTSDEEHPGLLGALAAARDILGATIREVPFARVAEEVGPATRFVACSHVSWATGALAPAELAEVEVPVLLDGAQGVGAIDVDVTALGCDAYAGAGQKWCCGPDGSGSLWVGPELRERLAVSRRGYGNLHEANEGLHADLPADPRRLHAPSLSAEALRRSAPTPGPPRAGAGRGGGGPQRWGLRRSARGGAGGLGGRAGVIAAAAVMNLGRLSQNGYANIFYSAGVRSMLRSWHTFFFVSSAPAGLVSIDKPPLGVWVQAASAKIFGFAPLRLLLPGALIGVAVVAVRY